MVEQLEIKRALILAKNDARLSVIKKAKGYGYNYATESDVLKVLHTILREHGISYNIDKIELLKCSLDENNNLKKDLLFNVTITLLHISGDEIVTHDLWAVTYNPVGKGIKNIAQAIGSAKTYGIRYYLCKQFGIANDEVDVDYLESKSQELENKKRLALIEKVKQDKALKEFFTKQMVRYGATKTSDLDYAQTAFLIKEFETLKTIDEEEHDDGTRTQQIKND